MFHRIDDIYAMPAPRFFRLATRLSAYAGVMQARVAALAETEAPAGTGTRSAGRMEYDTPDVVTPQSVVSDPLLAGLISFGTG